MSRNVLAGSRHTQDLLYAAARSKKIPLAASWSGEYKFQIVMLPTLEKLSLNALNRNMEELN